MAYLESLLIVMLLLWIVFEPLVDVIRKYLPNWLINRRPPIGIHLNGKDKEKNKCLRKRIQKRTKLYCRIISYVVALIIALIIFIPPFTLIGSVSTDLECNACGGLKFYWDTVLVQSFDWVITAMLFAGGPDAIRKALDVAKELTKKKKASTTTEEDKIMKVS